MPYATPQQVRAALARNVDQPVGTAATLDDAELQTRIDAAAAQVDAALRGAGYIAPLAGDVPVLVREITVAIAAWLADLTYRQNKDHSSVLDPVLQRYQWAREQLRDIAGRVVLVPGLPDPATPAEHAGAVVVSVQQPYDGDLFTPDDEPWGRGRDTWRDDWWW